MQRKFEDELYDEFRTDLIEVMYSGESVWPGTRSLNNQDGADLQTKTCYTWLILSEENVIRT